MTIKRTFLLLTIFLMPFAPGAKAQNAPTIEDATFTVDEYSDDPNGTVNGTLVGTVNASDPDGDVLSYSITDGNRNTAFSINALGGIIIANNFEVDYEFNPSYVLTVRVSDDETPSRTATATITINLNDVSPNDFCTNAITANIGETITGTTYDATTDWNVAPNCGRNRTDESSGSRGVWYRVLGNGETISVSTCSGTRHSFDDTSLSVYKGSCLSGLLCVADNEDTGFGNCGTSNREASLKFPSESGVEYYIFVDGYFSEVGNFDLTISSEPTLTPPDNDHCQNAETLTVFSQGTGTPTNGDNTAATAYLGETSCNNNISIPDVWYTFNSGPHIRVKLTTGKSTEGAVGGVALYEGCGEEAFLCRSSVRRLGDFAWDVEPNTDYWIQLWTRENLKGPFTIQLNGGPNTAPTVKSEVLEIGKYFTEGTILEIEDLATDNEGHAQKYSFSEGNDEGIFAIDEESGEITIEDEDALVATSATSVELTVKVDDQGPGTLSNTGVITVNIVDNAPPSVADHIAYIDENMPNETLLFTIEASDVDGDNLRYSITGGNTNNAFSINADGEIEVNNEDALDFESKAVFELEISVEDDGPLSLVGTGKATMNLRDVNDEPVVSDGSVKVSQYTTEGAILFDIDFEDEDAGQSHSYAITAGNTDNIFAINAEGRVYIVNGTDFSDNGALTYNLTVEVTDNGFPSKSNSATYTIEVFDNNPPEITTNLFFVDENTSNNSLVGTLAGSDDDGDDLTYSLVSGGLGAFSVATNGEVRVANSIVLDYESRTVINLRVKVEDDGDGNLSGEKEIQIYLIDINESPSISGFDVDISASFPNGTVLDQVEASDPDDDPINFSIEDGNDDNIFFIDEEAGILTIADASLLDPMSKPIHTLEIRASDGDIYASTFVDVVVYANDLPELTVNNFNLDENTANGYLLGSLTSDDIHPIANFEIIVESADQFFDLNEKTGELILDGPEILDYETYPRFDLTIRMTDGGVGSMKVYEKISILVNDLNEFTPVLDRIRKRSVRQLEEVTFRARASDEDGTAVLSYALDDASKDKGMSIDANSGVFNWTPGYQQFGMHTVEVTVNDGEFTDSKNVTVEVLRALGLEDGLQEGFAVYPNPAVSTVDLSLDNAYTGEVIVRVLDLAGKELMRKNVMKSQSKLQDKVDISALGAGIYFVELNMEATEKLVQRVIKQ